MTQLRDADGATRVHHRSQFRQTRKVSVIAVGDTTRPGHAPRIIDEAVLYDDHAHTAPGQRFIEAESQVADLAVGRGDAQGRCGLDHPVLETGFLDRNGG